MVRFDLITRKKGTSERKDLLSCLVIIPLRFFLCGKMSYSTQCFNCDSFHFVWVWLGVPAILSPSIGITWVVSCCG